MAHQQTKREEFGNDQRHYDVRHGHPDVIKNNDELDRWRDEFGSRTAMDPVANYAYGNIGSGGYGAPPTGGPYSGTDYAASGFEYSTAYGNTGAPTGVGERGREANADRGGDSSGRNKNMGRDQK